jgi:pyruvate kinase
MDRRAKIVATVGPASWDKKVLSQLIKIGVNVFRLNFSHGTYEEHELVIQRIRSIADDLQQPIALLQDLQGPKIRVGELQDGSVVLEPGKILVINPQAILGNQECISVDYPGIYKVVHSGSRILLDDGSLELSVEKVSGEEITTRVIVGGQLKSHKGVNVPNALIDLNPLTDKDLTDLTFGLRHEVDAIALSFVRSSKDIELLRTHIRQIKPDCSDLPIIAKLERPEALNHLREIVNIADGVMVARGDLGIEMSPEAVPIAQKQIIAEANRQGKLVITATQMLESMIQSPRPTRAETTDIANAIFDGTDAVMLSGETAIGKYPQKSVEMMQAIICKAEENLDQWGHWKGAVDDSTDNSTSQSEYAHDDALSMARAARELAHDRNVAAIAVFTLSGRTALLMSKVRPRVPILAFTPSTRTFQKLAFCWGVIPNKVPHANSVEEMLEIVEHCLVENTSIKTGQQIVLISGFPVGSMCPPNLAILYTIRHS